MKMLKTEENKMAMATHATAFSAFGVLFLT
jgi:hypothetical protein